MKVKLLLSVDHLSSTFTSELHISAVVNKRLRWYPELSLLFKFVSKYITWNHIFVYISAVVQKRALTQV